jgi:hypothetical protein
MGDDDNGCRRGRRRAGGGSRWGRRWRKGWGGAWRGSRARSQRWDRRDGGGVSDDKWRLRCWWGSSRYYHRRQVAGRAGATALRLPQPESDQANQRGQANKQTNDKRDKNTPALIHLCSLSTPQFEALAEENLSIDRRHSG